MPCSVPFYTIYVSDLVFRASLESDSSDWVLRFVVTNVSCVCFIAICGVDEDVAQFSAAVVAR